ncbi:AAA domain-containing protein [Nocardia sp. NPDC055053]
MSVSPMIGGVAVGWREEVVIALRRWRAMEAGGASEPSWRRVGSAVRAQQPGEFVVDMRGSMLGTDQLQAENLRLGESDRSAADKGYSVMEVLPEGSSIRVRVAEFADPVEPTVWLFQQPATFLIDSLIDGISGITDERLAGLLARGELAGELSTASLPAGLMLPSQDLAYRACRGRGLWMVWGPPGTGKTSVLTRAIGDLIAEGKRVLLVSATNVAVDNVVVKVAPIATEQPGAVVRVGTPHLQQVAENAEVCLPLMVRARLDDLDRERATVAKDLAGISKRAAELDALDSALAEFDRVRFEQAERRTKNPAFAVDYLAGQIASATGELDTATASRARARRAVESKQRRVDDIADDRARWDEITRLTTEYAELEGKSSSAELELILGQQELADAEFAVTSLEKQPAWERLRNRSQLSAARASRDALLSEMPALTARRDRIVKPIARQMAHLRAEIDRIQRRTAVSQDAVQAALAALHRAESEHTHLEAQRLRWETDLRRLEDELNRTEVAADVVKSDRRRGFPAKHAQTELLRVLCADDATREAGLRAHHRDLEETYAAMAKDAQGEIIRSARLVATTLARFRTNAAVLAGAYDVVLVDEAGAAALPDVLLAVSVAQRTAILLGDFMQLGPVVPRALNGSRDAGIKRWLLTEVFEQCGITSTRTAAVNPGCITLDVQHRFGRAVMDLVNDIAYDGLLSAGPTIQSRYSDAEPGEAEIVLVDTDELTDLGQVYLSGRASGWWPAGLLLSRAIAEMHAADSTTIGVVTPYAMQAEATLEGMRQIEHDNNILAEVGTAHRFQGREFGVVIFDLVESADGPRMWMAKAGSGPSDGTFARDGLRLFNVAVTRVQQRVYLIGSRRRVETSPGHTALGALAKMLAGRRVRTLSAAALVTPQVGDTVLGPVGARLAEILARHVEVSDIQDEKEFYRTFEERLDRANESIWIWAPWVATRVRSLLPVLRRAAERGVRIVAFVRDPSDKLQQRCQDYVDELAVVVDTVIYVHEMHQKIVVIDERLVLLGSLNPLSQSRTREVMLAMHGNHFARKILAGQHADIFSQPPACEGCLRRDVDLKRGQKGWYWRCRNQQCPQRKDSRAWKQDIDLGEPEPSTSRRGARHRPRVPRTG